MAEQNQRKTTWTRIKEYSDAFRVGKNFGEIASFLWERLPSFSFFTYWGYRAIEVIHQFIQGVSFSSLHFSANWGDWVFAVLGVLLIFKTVWEWPQRREGRSEPAFRTRAGGVAGVAHGASEDQVSLHRLAVAALRRERDRATGELIGRHIRDSVDFEQWKVEVNQWHECISKTCESYGLSSDATFYKEKLREPVAVFHSANSFGQEHERYLAVLSNGITLLQRIIKKREEELLR